MEPTDDVIAEEPTEDYCEYLLWIQTSEENLPYLESINIRVGDYTGMTYLNCWVPKWAIADLWNNYGEVVFGVMEEGEDTVELWHAANAKRHSDIVIKYHGNKAVPGLVEMGFMKKPAARKVGV